MDKYKRPGLYSLNRSMADERTEESLTSIKVPKHVHSRLETHKIGTWSEFLELLLGEYTQGGGTSSTCGYPNMDTLECSGESVDYARIEEIVQERIELALEERSSRW